MGILERSNLPVDTLRQVWNLSDIDRDGQLDSDEFAVAMHLCRDCTTGKALPATLPADLIPPSCTQRRETRGVSRVVLDRVFRERAREMTGLRESRDVSLIC